MAQRARYQRPGVDYGRLGLEPEYEAPDQPSVPDTIETTADDTEHRPDTKVPEVLPEPHHVAVGEAVPVRIIEPVRVLDRITRATLYSYILAAGQRVVLPGRRNRLRLRLRSTTDGETIEVSHQDNLLSSGPFPLVAGQPDIELKSQGTVYVRNPGANEATLGVVEEYVTEIQ